MLTAVLSGGCSERTAGATGGQLDSAAQAARAARREAFLKHQETLTKEHEALRQEALRAWPFEAVLTLQRPTVIAFYPAWTARLDTAARRALLEPSKAIAAEAGWAFEERHSGSLRVIDPRSQALYTVPVLADSMGLVLAAPGRVPQVLYGRDSALSLKARLGALRDWLSGGAPRSQTRL